MAKFKLKTAIFCLFAFFLGFIAGCLLTYLSFEKEIIFLEIRETQQRIDKKVEKIEQNEPLIREELENLKMQIAIWQYEVEKTLNWHKFIEVQADPEEEK